MLKRVSIQNFKSLKDVTLDLQKVNLLIGPNNSGKTNFLKALEYMLKDNTNQNEPDYKRLAFNQNPENQISIRFEYDYNREYNVNTIFETTINKSDEIVKSNWIYQDKQLVKHQRSNSGSYDTNELKSRTGEVKIYKPDPNKLDEPGPVGGGEETVSADASNLVGFLDLMLSKYRKVVFGLIETDIKTCIPEFDEIKLDDVPATEKIKKQFGDRSIKRIGLANSISDSTYWADELSEGTLYFLAFLCIIHQPNPPKLLLLEEPEKGIHPRRIHEVMNFIFRLADEKDIQIILTTHNENVLNGFTSMPEAVFVFNKDEEGATYVYNLKSDIIDPSHERSRQEGLEEIDFTDDLGKNWMYGLLGGVPTEEL
jgi:AAA15 family ATPase/GTPase